MPVCYTKCLNYSPLPTDTFHRTPPTLFTEPHWHFSQNPTDTFHRTIPTLFTEPLGQDYLVVEVYDLLGLGSLQPHEQDLSEGGVLLSRQAEVCYTIVDKQDYNWATAPGPRTNIPAYKIKIGSLNCSKKECCGKILCRIILPSVSIKIWQRYRGYLFSGVNNTRFESWNKQNKTITLSEQYLNFENIIKLQNADTVSYYCGYGYVHRS